MKLEPVSVMPDAEILAKEWAWSMPGIRDLLDNGDGTFRCANTLPNNPQFPFLTVQSIGGGPAYREAPVYEAFIQWDAYAASGRDLPTRPDYAAASILARQVIAYARATVRFGGANGGHILGFELFDATPIALPSDEGWARRSCSMLMTMKES